MLNWDWHKIEFIEHQSRLLHYKRSCSDVNTTPTGINIDLVIDHSYVILQLQILDILYLALFSNILSMCPYVLINIDHYTKFTLNLDIVMTKRKSNRIINWRHKHLMIWLPYLITYLYLVFRPFLLFTLAVVD